jgi:molybdate transport system substrate-binding protein
MRSMNESVNILSAGAAKGLLNAIAAQAGIEIVGEFGAVGAMRERMNAGAACDVIILTDAMIDELAAAGKVEPSSVVALGKVSTGVARLSAAQTRAVDSASDLKDLLSTASRIYFPDPVRATAGIHVMKVLTELGLAQSHSARFATYPNGATAMRAMADAGDINAVGATQASEIIYTEGVQYIGALPDPFALTTGYSAALITDAANARVGRHLLLELRAESNARIRLRAGFS